MILDLFAGPGGWDEGLRNLGRPDVLGLDSNEIACDTARNAGHARRRKDVSKAEPLDYEGFDGLIASPPCQGFSQAGERKGAVDLPDITEAAQALGRGLEPSRVMSKLRNKVAYQDSALVVEPLRYAMAMKPIWIALEQVPAILPVWQAMAEILSEHGYETWSGYVHAEQYGAPQTRKRAILLAHLHKFVYRPAPTHAYFDVREPDRVVGGPQKWVSMAEGLGWHPDEPLEMRSAYTRGGNLDVRNTRRVQYPSFTVTSNIGKNKWQPTEGEGRWSRETPKAGRLLTLGEAGQLQSFPKDYPWAGNRTQAVSQIGDAMPPALASALLAQCL